MTIIVITTVFVIVDVIVSRVFKALICCTWKHCATYFIDRPTDLLTGHVRSPASRSLIIGARF